MISRRVRITGLEKLFLMSLGKLVCPCVALRKLPPKVQALWVFCRESLSYWQFYKMFLGALKQMRNQNVFLEKIYPHKHHLYSVSRK